ncbi:MAG: hypothetical protein LKG42_08420 [Eubacterium sp.]|nr:hypothetical protein [Eubacterium sp.]MCH4047389.1 hypothetical protein [Eubacterium sp.]MCH4080486.1 hypothetical protein [Eubacterium sp.]MCI1308027.1 hypothetical protein [Eubacterium sp.]
MNIIMNQKYAGAAYENNGGSHDMHVFDFNKMSINDIEHAGCGKVRIIRDDKKTIADDPAGVYELADGSTAYITKTLQVINPEDAATSTHAVVVALYEMPYDLVVFTRCSAREMSDEDKLTLYNACVYRNQGFALETCRCYAKDFDQVSDFGLPLPNDSWLHSHNLDVFDIPTWGKNDSFPLLSMIVPYDYR